MLLAKVMLSVSNSTTVEWYNSLEFMLLVSAFLAHNLKKVAFDCKML